MREAQGAKEEVGQEIGRNEEVQNEKREGRMKKKERREPHRQCF